MSTTRAVVSWVVTSLLAGLFIFAGIMKFADAEAAQHFAEWGLPGWFRVVIGAVGIAGGVGRPVPRATFYAAAGLAVVMAGAVSTLLRHGEAAQALVPLALLILLLAVGYARRPRFGFMGRSSQRGDWATPR